MWKYTVLCIAWIFTRVHKDLMCSIYRQHIIRFFYCSNGGLIFGFDRFISVEIISYHS